MLLFQTKNMDGNLFLRLVLTLILVFQPAIGRIHKLELKDDNRNYITLSTFGFYKNGYLEVQLTSLSFSPFSPSKTLGFSLEKTTIDASNPYTSNRQEKCMLEDEKMEDGIRTAFILFTLNLQDKLLQVNCSQHLQNIHIFHNYTDYVNNKKWMRAARDITRDDYLLANRHRRSPKASAQTPSKVNPQLTTTEKKLTSVYPPQCGTLHINLSSATNEYNTNYYAANFTIAINTDDEEGLYNLHFHNCPNYHYSSEGRTSVNLSMIITERNSDNYLSAGEMPLPALYFTMSVLFCLCGCFWTFILHKSSKEDVYATHYLMAVLVYIKSLSLMFHAINFHFIELYGTHIEGWAVLYYITHLLRGALMFMTIILIGTGWTFIKRIFSEKEKKTFMIVIPLQILANVTEIIMEESEEGDTSYVMWRVTFFFVDLLCCGAILFPVVWSIRHLQDASQESGKAVSNLQKLKMFRHFYILIVCYIYFSRIIVALLRITVPFQYEWLIEMLREMATFAFYVLTGYKFRPTSNHPYFQLALEDPDLEMEEVITPSGTSESLTKVNRHKQDSK